MLFPIGVADRKATLRWSSSRAVHLALWEGGAVVSPCVTLGSVPSYKILGQDSNHMRYLWDYGLFCLFCF